ncbi:MAG: cytochrome b [Wenzhouxiangella sp.]
MSLSTERRPVENLSMNASTHYPVSARLFHWGMAALILSMLLAGLAMVQTLQPWHLPIVAAHKFFGLIALLAVLARLANRLRFRAPALPSELGVAQQWAARVVQILLYGAMLAMPLSGYLMVSASGQGVSLLGLLTLPPLGEASLVRYSFYRELHAMIAWALIVLVVVHIGAALHHGLIRRDGVLSSMLRK